MIFMEIKIVGKEITVTEAIKDYVEKKLERIDKYFDMYGYLTNT